MFVFHICLVISACCKMTFEAMFVFHICLVISLCCRITFEARPHKFAANAVV